MNIEDTHPFASPKGQVVLTVVLTLLAAVAPFYGTFEFAIFLAVVSVGIISSIYYKEFKELNISDKGLSGLGVPLVAIVLIFAIISFTAVAVSLRPKSEVRPALTRDDVVRAAEAIPVIGNDAPRKEVLVIEVPRYSEPENSTPPINASNSSANSAAAGEGNSLDALIKGVHMRSAGMNEYYECVGERSKASAALMGLNFGAAQMQNAYYYGRDSKLMVQNLNEWKKKAEKVFQDHKEILPSIDVFNLAMSERKARNFLGIDNSGDNAWAEMNAKSKVLSAIAKQLDDTSACQKIRDAAIEQCRISGNCASGDSKPVNSEGNQGSP